MIYQTSSKPYIYILNANMKNTLCLRITVHFFCLRLPGLAAFFPASVCGLIPQQPAIKHYVTP